MSTEVCYGCGRDLSDVERDTDADVPCPECGTAARIASEVVAERSSGQDYIQGVGGPDGRTAFVTESPRTGLASSAELSDDSIEQTLKGTPVPGEGDTVAVCSMLIGALNSAGANWSDPVPGDGNEDCLIRANAGSEVVAIQVVRGVVHSEFLHSLARRGTRTDTWTLDQASEVLFAAVHHKVGPAGIPESSRADLWLLLDANRVPALAFPEVVERFESEHGEWVRSLGFAQVWLVGPAPQFVHQLA